jgi:hypothetical protein
VTFRFPGSTTPEGKHDGILVMRSDGKILRRLVGDLSTGYSIAGTAKSEFIDGRVLGAFCVRRNWTIVEKVG